MKFFWKVFFSTILIAAATFSFGSYYLIDAQFRTALDREIASAYEENDILCYTFTANKQFQEIISAYQDNINQFFNLNPGEKTITSEQARGLADDQRELLRQTARSVTINTSRGTVPFRLSDSSLETIYLSSDLDIDNSMLRKLPPNARGYRLVMAGGSYYLHAASPLLVQGERLYLENFRDVGFLFENRSDRYQDFSRLMIAMILISGGVIFAITQWLTKPLRRLSRATKRLADGDFGQRLAVQGSDEISMLARDYNAMADRLEAMVEELKDTSRRQEDFIGSFAHELKTPLTSIIGYADMLRSKKLDQEQVVLSANYIFREGKRLEALSMKLLDLIVLGRQDFPLKTVNARSFFAAIQGLMLPALVKEGIRFTVKADQAPLQIEPDLLKTVCLNLLDNARKSLDGQGGHILFTGMLTREGYRIQVEDDGKGMEKEEIGRITEAFYMVDKSRARAQGGAGLGLAICAEILRLHNTRLEFDSRQGLGTRVSFLLPGEYAGPSFAEAPSGQSLSGQANEEDSLRLKEGAFLREAGSAAKPEPEAESAAESGPGKEAQ